MTCGAPRITVRILRGLVQAFHVAILPGKPSLAKCFGILGAKSTVAADAPHRARRRKPCLGAFADQSVFKLGRGAQDLKRELALRRGSVDRIPK